MSSIEGFIADTTRRLANAKAVAAKYPDVTLSDLPDGSYVFTSGLAAKDANEVEIVAGKVRTDPPVVYVCPYVKVGDSRVYACGWPAGVVGALARLKFNHPAAYALLVAAAVSEAIGTQ